MNKNVVNTINEYMLKKKKSTVNINKKRVQNIRTGHILNNATHCLNSRVLCVSTVRTS